MNEFNGLSEQLRDDMNTYQKEFNDVKSDMNNLGAQMKESVNNV